MRAARPRMAAPPTSPYVTSRGLTIPMSNRHFKFDPSLPGQVVTIQTEDGTEVKAPGYAFYKGATTACTVPLGRTGPVLIATGGKNNGFLRGVNYSISLG